MLKRRVEELDPVAVEMPGTKGVSVRLMVGRADGAPTFAMRHYTVAAGGFTPRHQHDYEHEVILTGGEARVEYDGAFEKCRAGDILLIAANRMHQFVNEGSGDLTFFCLVPVSFDCGKPTPGS
ncbi:MAG: cupin domain-containing protein [Phycisphaerales bacterium]|nr:cupin domain-containing protein [Phycisphaerales bacterium]